MIVRYLEDVAKNSLRFEENRTFFLILILKGDSNWRYRVDKLHPRVQDFCPCGRSCWCNWQPIEMTLTEPVDHLRETGAYDQHPSPTTSQEDIPPSGDEMSEGEATHEERNPVGKGVIL